MSDETSCASALFSRYEEAPLKPAAKLNPQLYENSFLSGSAVESDYLNSEDVLFNSKSPNLRVEHEKPEHRIVLFLKAQGLSNREISQRTGYTEPWISQVLRQPWARARLVRELQEAGRDAVQEVIKAAALDSVYRLIDERDNDKAKPSERITAANSLLDRFLGKPLQKVENHTTMHEGIAEVDKLRQELATLEAETNKLTGKN